MKQLIYNHKALQLVEFRAQLSAANAGACGMTKIDAQYTRLKLSHAIGRITTQINEEKGELTTHYWEMLKMKASLCAVGLLCFWITLTILK